MAVHSIFLRTFVDEIVRKTGRDRESVETELLDAARAAVREHFGEATPVSVALSPDIGEVTLRQELLVVDAPRDRGREISVLDVRRVGLDAEEGATVAVPVFYTGGHDADIERLAPWKGIAPLPLHDETFWDALNAKLNPAVQKYFPPKQHPAGTLGHLLQSGGAWTIGASATSGGTTVTIERAYLRITSLSPTHEWADYGFVLRVTGGPGTRQLELDRGDNEGNIRSWCELPTSERSRPQLEETLAGLAKEIDAEYAKPAPAHCDPEFNANLRFVNGYTWTSHLVVAALKQAGPGSLMLWMQENLPPAIEGHTCAVTVEEGTVTFRVTRMYPPDVGLSGFGSAAVRLTAHVEGQPEVVYDDVNHAGDVIPLGSVEREALDRPGPLTDDERRDVDAIVATFLDWLDEHLHWHVAQYSIDTYIDQPMTGMFYAFPGYFPLVELIQRRLLMGPPGPPPVPPFDDAALDLAARSLKPVLGQSRQRVLGALAMKEEAQGNTFGVFSVKGWTILLSDDLERAPFSLPEISLVPPEGGPPVMVMMVDAWNPQARTVVDGDAFAFRRFLGWLREAILRGGYDADVEFTVEDDPDADEESDEGETSVLEMKISSWLLFEMPETGDRYLVDWRAQWHVVNAIGRVEDFAGIYGFTGEFLEGLRTRAIPQWRRFLREVIDPRFDATTGAKLLR